jgi:hypothetical protein
MVGSSSKVLVATEASEMRDDSYNVSDGNEAIDSCILSSAQSSDIDIPILDLQDPLDSISIHPLQTIKECSLECPGRFQAWPVFHLKRVQINLRIWP